MNPLLYDWRCRCNEKVSITKKPKSSNKSEGRPLKYPKLEEIKSKTFQIQYDYKLSLNAKFILNSFQNKYIYYAIDDILYNLKASPIERDNLLTILYSPILSLQNNFSVNFFDIWIHQIYIEEISKTNKFLSMDSHFTYITIQFFYKTKVPFQKQEALW